MKHTKVFWQNLYAYNDGYQYICNQGGTRSSKTYSLLQLLLEIALRKENQVISVCSVSMPHLKRGALRDFEKMLKDSGIYSKEMHNRTDNIFKFGTSIIEFFSVDDFARVLGPGRDILFINEAPLINFETFDQLQIRTRGVTFLDWNPIHEFWAHTKVIPYYEGVKFIRSTYKDNDQLDPRIVKKIEARKDMPGMENWWRVYGLGEIGILEGAVFPIFHTIDAFPIDCKIEALGLDFGYTNDPTALVRFGVQGDNIYIEQLIYETGLTNQDICKRLDALGIDRRMEIFADSSEPKSIEEIYREGWNIKPAAKGQDSVVHGIDLIKRYGIYVTNQSTDIVNEFRNYTWLTNKGGDTLNKPIDRFNHAIDAIRYVASAKLVKRPGRIISVYT